MRENGIGYRLFFETAPDGMLIVGTDGKVLDANPQARELLRRTREETVGTDLEDLSGSSYPILKTALEASNSGQGPTTSARFLRGDGSSFPAEVRMSGDGEGCFGVSFREIARREGGEASRSGAGASVAEYRAMVEGSADAMAVFDPNNTFRYANPAFEQLLGYESEELVGTFVPDVVHPDDLARGAALVVGIQNSPGPVRVPGEFRYRHKDGHWVYLETSMNNLMDDPEVRGIVAICRDVTGRREAEERLRESEERFRALAENALDFVVVQKADNTLSYVSPSIERLLGWKPEEAIGKVGAEFIHPEDLEWAWPVFYEQLQRPGINEGVVIRYRHKDGSWRWFESNCNNQLENPAVEGLVFNCRDITERVETEKRLKESEERHRALTENAADLTVVQRPDATISYASPSMKRVLGYQPEDWVGVAATEFIHPEDLREAWEAFQEVVENPGAIRSRTLRYLHKDGSWRYLETVCNNQLENPAVGGLIFNCRDVTGRLLAERELRESEERLARSNRELARSNTDLEQFAYVVSHGLRSPLRGVVNASEALLEDHAGNLDNEGRDFLRGLRDSALRMRQIVEDVLDLSRATYRPLAREPVDLSALAFEIAGDLREAEPGREVEFMIRGGLVAEGDTNLLRLALENLVSNAWKYTSKKERAKIEFGTVEDGETTAYFVRDDGAGFDMGRAGQLFEPFRRLHRASEFEGTGIGLATVRRILDRHGGRVWAEGEEGCGATFFFTLGRGAGEIRGGGG